MQLYRFLYKTILFFHEPKDSNERGVFKLITKASAFFRQKNINRTQQNFDGFFISLRGISPPRGPGVKATWNIKLYGV